MSKNEKTFILSVTWQVKGFVEAKGVDIDDAFHRFYHENMIDDGLENQLPNGYYISDSLEHDREGSLLRNDHEQQ